MKDLLYKEFKLFWNPALNFILLAGVLLLIPQWPYPIAFEYIIFVGFVTAFFTARSDQDVFFSVSLPIRKRDTVLARVCTIAVLELLQIIAAIPFAVINNAIYLKGNVVGMNTNFAFFGSIFIMYAIFNLIFLPGFYKTAYNVGIPMLIGIIVANVYIAVVDTAVLFVPILKTNLNGLGASHFASQLSVLLSGIVLFTLLTMLAYRISANRFEKVDV